MASKEQGDTVVTTLAVERFVSTADQAKDVMQECERTLGAILQTSDKFPIYKTLQHPSTNLTISLKATTVQGPTPTYAKNGMLLSFAEIPVHCGAHDFYNFLVSKEGYVLLDPDANPDDFDQPILGPFEGWKSSSKLQLEYANLALPGAGCVMSSRDYVILNGHDATTKTFYSVSVQTDVEGYQGASDYCESGKTIPSRDGRVRMAFWAAYRVVPSADDSYSSSSTLVVAQWIDLCGWIPKLLLNSSQHVWFEGLVKRLEEKFPTFET